MAHISVMLKKRYKNEVTDSVLWVSIVWKSSFSSSVVRTPSEKYDLNSSKDSLPSSVNKKKHQNNNHNNQQSHKCI